MNQLPKFLKQYFWDVDFEKMDAEGHRIDVIRRILNYGDEKAIRWMYKNFDKSEIKYALTDFRGYSQKSANYWALILGLPRERILCLKRRSSGQPKTFWPY